LDLKEYEGRKLFSRYGIPVPRGFLLEKFENDRDLEDAKLNMENFLKGSPDVEQFVLKAQLLSGKRGKSGGIVFSGKDDFIENVKSFRKREIAGSKEYELLAVERLEDNGQFYLSVSVDRFERCPVIIFSAEGGIDIEDTAESNPENIHKIRVRDINVLPEDELLKIPVELNLNKNLGGDFLAMTRNLFGLFINEDCTLAEINPIILTKDEKLYAADAKIVIDDNALFRHADYLPDYLRGFSDLEKEAKKSDLAYVELNGNVAVIGNGAGLVMATLDALDSAGAEPANFCDIGGGATLEMMEKALGIVLRKAGVKVIFVNIFGGITHCDVAAAALADYIKKHKTSAPVIVRMTGTNEEEGRNILLKNGIKSFISFKEAIENVSSLAG
jgi:succinyl-CoA synthetase beta subunit